MIEHDNAKAALTYFPALYSDGVIPVILLK